MKRIDDNPYFTSISLLFTLLFNYMDQSLLKKLRVAHLVEKF
jgi:hypothetical protein